MSRSPAEAPRTLLLSERGAESRKWHAFQYEFEDVIAAVDDVALLAPPAMPEGRRRRLLDRFYYATGRLDRVTSPALRPVRIVQHHELFFTTFSFVTDVPHLLRLGDLRKRCDIATCFFVELFSEHVDKYRRNLELLRRFEFDRVYVFNPAPKDDIAEIVGCPVEFLPLGVDALQFSPYPSPPARTVDLYQFGRRSPVTHAAALEMARQEGAFYLYDTIFNVPLPDYRAHRRLIAEQMKRSRYFFAYKASVDLGRGAADDVLSARYFEATAGGAVLLGSAPATPEWDACFDWEDAVIEIPYEAHDLREIVADLDAQPERLERARMRNMVGALRRHDWVYRWAQVLDDLDLPHS
ncbi:MAG TPA: glycosyltransferase, partial [Solirubrobacteraceae bacterium]|nr:glycosyltransferase [Solirubrobacteraceae bacterium]